jgi:oligopeptidase B
MLRILVRRLYCQSERIKRCKPVVLQLRSKQINKMTQAPIADRIEHNTVVHGVKLSDPYYWLREKSNDKVIDYIKKENQYLEEYMKETEDLQDKLYNEFVNRVQQTDVNVPYRYGDWYYYSRTVEGKQYSIYCRKKRLKNDEMDEHEQIVLDLNQISEEEKLQYLSLGVYKPTPDHNILAYSLDKKGDEIYTLYFKDLRTGQLLPGSGVLSNLGRSLQWYNDSRTFLYTTLDSTLRPWKVHKHTLSDNTNPCHGEAIFTDPDERFWVYLTKPVSSQIIMIGSTSKVTCEYHLTDANDTSGTFKVILPRKQDLEYSVTHHEEYLYIWHNANNYKNFHLVRVPISKVGIVTSFDDPAFEDVMPYDPQRHINMVIGFKNFLVVFAREEGLSKLMIRNYEGGAFYAEMPDAAYEMGLSSNEVYDTTVVRIYYSSLVTPDSWFDYNTVTRSLILLKEKPVLGGYDRTQYIAERIHVPSLTPNVNIPVSLIYKKSLRSGPMPCLLYGYGSYGISYDPRFDFNAISLLDRGFVYAIAHIRGGSEYGRPWYDDGKMQLKKNTFNDFIQAAKGLINLGYTTSDQLAISGGSAGGLLMGAAVNMAPELFRVAIFKVPFVDCLNTMLDATIPLTVTEYEEWGNPEASKEVFDYIRSYSPYDNIINKENFDKNYPAILVTSGLNDPRVQYWEPTKYVAMMRYYYNEIKKGKGTRLLFLKTNMGAGHGGKSGRYERWRDEAFVYAFILRQLRVE